MEEDISNKFAQITKDHHSSSKNKSHPIAIFSPRQFAHFMLHSNQEKKDT